MTPAPVVHFEFSTKDPKSLQKFYGEVFDWKIDANNPMEYGMVDTGEGGCAGGIGGVPDENYPGHLTIYAMVPDLEATLKEIEARGGKTLMEPMEVPGGPTIAMFSDPAGNVVGLTKA